MANIRINSLPATTSVLADDVLPMDGASTRKIKPGDLLASVRPFATQLQAETGTDAVTAMSPLTTAQAIAAKLPSTAAGRALLNGTDAAAQRSSLGLGNSSTRAVGTVAGTVAAGDDIRFAGVAGIVDQATAEAGTNNTGIMSPLRTSQQTVSKLANPSGTIGLSAVNGSAATLMRSDAAPALSQAIAPTWTALHTHTGGEEMTGAPPLTRIFTGSGLDAKMHANISGTAASATVPEIGLQVTMTSDVGSGLTTAYKIPLTYSILGGVNSAPIYGENGIVQGYGSTYLMLGGEDDLNQQGPGHADTLGATAASYGRVAVAAGSFRSTAGFWATGATASFNYGFAVSNHGANGAHSAGFHDASSSSICFQGIGTHDTLLDGSNSSVLFGMTLPNNTQAIAQLSTSAAFLPVIKLNASDNVEIAGTGVGGISVMTSVYPGADNVYSLGAAPSFRFSSVAAATGTIITSDETEKTDTKTIAPATAMQILRDVAAEDKGFMTFRWISGGSEPVEVEEEGLVHATETVVENYEEYDHRPDGTMQRVVKTRTVGRPVYDDVPVFNPDGSPAMEVRTVGQDGGVEYQVTRRLPRMVQGTVKKTIYQERAGVREHAGSSAQVWRRVLADHDYDLGLVTLSDPTDPNSRHSMRPDQEIPFIGAAVVDVDARLAEALKAVQALTKRVASLEKRLGA